MKEFKDDITVEIAQKVRDSLAILMGGARCSTNKANIWKEYVNHLNEGGQLKIVAWVELDVSTENLLQRAKVNIYTRKRELRKRLTGLTSDVQILNTRNYKNEVKGLHVQLT